MCFHSPVHCFEYIKIFRVSLKNNTNNNFQSFYNIQEVKTLIKHNNPSQLLI